MPYFKKMWESFQTNGIIDLCDNFDVEVICINDGSTDDSVRFMKSIDFPQNFYLLTARHEGVARARNLGLSVCKGDYIWFVDADDIIPENAILSVISKLNSFGRPIDILFANFFAFEETANTFDKVFHSQYLFENFYGAEDKFDVIFNKARIGFTIWNQIFNVSFLKQNSLRFNSKYCVSEDLMFKMEAVYKAVHFDYIETEIYGYRVPNGRKTLSQKKPFFQEIEPLLDDQAKWFDTFENDYHYFDGSHYMRLLLSESINMWLNYFKKHDKKNAKKVELKQKELSNVINYLPMGVSALFHKGI